MSASIHALISRTREDAAHIKVHCDDESDLVPTYLETMKLVTNLSLVRKQLCIDGVIKNDDISKEFHEVFKSLLDMKFELEYEIEKQQSASSFVPGSVDTEDTVLHRDSISTLQLKSTDEDEPIEALRKRLLSTRDLPSELDALPSAQIQNEQHESFQKELIDSLPSMVSSLKDQAFQFQHMLKQDATILKEASENFESSRGIFEKVNGTLSKYHREGKLGIWFYIRVILFVFLTFAFFLFLIRLIPARY
ncbi:hypothetical protein OGAPHI_004648 [Ogataea philodendri]|uniref:Uncharacterized protein n=1 Tax=Ogataea philodendri TaxID=1378263 RepID=A0A9P8T3Y9_9ASCO|nr:uncharacterized protein OGAPHI_004648 [Ogataea philodendri]KAH3664296.1 hypothetical protein OGAPHI_004648 [Ogataea philodendri]